MEFWDLAPIEFNSLSERYLDLARLEDVRSARLVCILANAYRDEDKHPEPFELDDFLLIESEDTEHAKQTPEEMLLMVQALNAIYGGEVTDN